MLDTKAGWDELIRRHAPDAEIRDAVLANPLYQNITSRFVHSHDYLAMEQLHDLHATGDFDLVIVDTPPSRNALSILDAPSRMVDFFGSRLLRWLTVPYRSRLFTVASKPFYQVADRVLGSRFLQDIADFFVLFQAMESGFVERARAVEALLVDPRTAFVVVTTLETAPSHEAQFLASALLEREHVARCDRRQPGAARGARRARRPPTSAAALLDRPSAALAGAVAGDLDATRGADTATGRASVLASARRAVRRRCAGRLRGSRSGEPNSQSLAPTMLDGAVARRRHPRPRRARSLAEHLRRPTDPRATGRHGDGTGRRNAMRGHDHRQTQVDDLPGRSVPAALVARRDDIDHLHRLAAEWAFLADLCFADLLLYVRSADGKWVVVDQVRPATNQTMYVTDYIGTWASRATPPYPRRRPPRRRHDRG